MTASNREPLPPCASCKRPQWRARKDGSVEHYRGEPFGLVGMICPTCRARSVRHQRAIAAGRIPGKFGNPRQASGKRGPRPAELVVVISPEEAEANLRELIAEQERTGLRPRSGETAEEAARKRWAIKAAAARRAVVAERQAWDSR